MTRGWSAEIEGCHSDIINVLFVVINGNSIYNSLNYVKLKSLVFCKKTRGFLMI